MNGTDLWQPNDQLINKHFRRQMRKLITEHGLRNENNLTNDGKIPRPSYAELVLMVARAIDRVNNLYTERVDSSTGEIIRTGVVRRSWELSGWIKDKPVNDKLRDIMDKDFSQVDHDNAIDKVYNKSYRKRKLKAPSEPLPKVCTVFHASLRAVCYFVRQRESQIAIDISTHIVSRIFLKTRVSNAPHTRCNPQPSQRVTYLTHVDLRVSQHCRLLLYVPEVVS